MKKTRLRGAAQKNSARLFFTALLMGVCLLSNGKDVKAEYKKAAESELPISTMSVYKEMDYSFLKTFPFGTTYEGKVNVELETAQQMIEGKDVRLKAGRIVQTSGFFEANDGGGATYELSASKTGGCIELSNGLYANIIMDTKVINGQKWGIISAKQLGAKGDGEQPDNARINDAVGLGSAFANDNEDVFRSIVYLPSGEYKCTNQVQINVSNVNFVGDGKNSVVFTDNDYRKGMGYYEFFFTMWGAKDLYMADFLVEAREVNGYNYMRQMVFVDCDNVYTYNVDLNIPQEAFSKDYFVDKQYSSLTYYSGNKNMTLDSCKLELMCSTYRGANLGILDFYSRGEENITVMNCEFHSDARDEQVGIFSSRQNKEASFIRNVYFVNNTMYSYQPLDMDASGGHRTMCFTVAYNDSMNISDVYIKGNHFIADLDSKFMTFGNGIESCVVEDNMIDVRCTDNLGAYLFDSSVTASERVLIQNNEISITYRDTENMGKAGILQGKATVKGNRIISDTWMGNMGYLNGIYEDNTYINLGYLGNITNYLEEFRNNKIISYGGLDKVMFFSGGSTDQTVNFSGNYIVDYKRDYGKYNMWSAIAEVRGTLKELNFTGNTILAPNKYYWTWQDVDNPKVPAFIKGVFFRDASIGKAVIKDNVLQGADIYDSYGCTVSKDSTEQVDSVVNLVESNNETKEFTLDQNSTVCTDIRITKDGTEQTDIFTDQASVSLGAIVKAGHLNDEEECTDEAVVTDKELVWYSSLEGVGSVDDNGVVTRKNYGETAVFAVPADGSQKKSGNYTTAVFGKCNIHFVKGFANGITFEKDNITLQTSKKYKVVYEVQPADKASQNVKWTSSDMSVATVNSIGSIEAVGVGETDIICSTMDGTNISKKIHVKVEELTVKKITLNESAWYDYEYEKENTADRGVQVGDTIQLSVLSYTPDSAVNKGIKKWVSTNEEVAIVDENGFVKATGGGYCEIRAYSLDEKCYGTCVVCVQPDAIDKEDISVSYTHERIKLSWKQQENIHGYIVYCDKGDGNGYQEVARSTSPENTEYIAYSTSVGWYVEAGKTYKYKVAAYIKRVDTNSYTHIYETPSDEISVTTYSNPVISSFNTNGVETLGVTVGGTTHLTVYCSKNTMPSSYRSSDESIFTVEDTSPDGGYYELDVTGVKEGMAYLILKGEDELGYEKKIPVYVYDFQETGSNIEAESLIKSIGVKWKVDNIDGQDGFKIKCQIKAQKQEVLVPMNQLRLTQENGELYASYTIGGLENEKTYSVSVAPYKTVGDETFAGSESKQLQVSTLAYVNVNSITAENLHLLRVNESKKITAVVGPEAASEPNIVWIPYHSSIIEVTESGEVDKTTRYAVIKGLKAGISKLNAVVNDDDNYQIELKAVVVPAKVTQLAGKTDIHSVSLSWSSSEGAMAYAVYRYDSKQKKWVNIAKVTDVSYVDSGLNPDTQYQYKIAACISDKDGIYEGDHTSAIVLKTQKDPETQKVTEAQNTTEVQNITETVVPFNERKVESFKISKNYTTKVKLSWVKDKEAQGYQIYQYKSKKWKSIATIKKGSTQSVNIKKLKPGTSYQFRIRAYKKENGKTVYTQYTTLKVMTLPSKVKVTSASAGKKTVTLKWKKVKASGYEIQCCTSKKFKKSVTKVTVKKSKKKATVKKLKAGRTYYVRIRAYSKVNGKKYYGAWSKVKKVKVTR